MKDLYLELDHRALHLMEFIGHEAENLGVKVYLVGGIVRDLMLKRENLDLDIVVEGNGIILAQAVSDKKKGKVTVYPTFKTATVSFPNGVVIDFATARSEIYKTSGALPQVTEGTIHDDLYRRDFTINAMAIALNADCLGKLIDDFAGLKDLKNKKIRILHSKSFQDDPTRILRAVRFQKRLNFQIEPETLKLMKKAIAEGAISRVKPQRWFEEFRKILKEDDAPECIKQLAHYGAMSFVAKPFSCDFKLLKKIQKTFSDIPKKWNNAQAIDRGLVYLLALLYRINKIKLRAHLQKWNLTREEIKKILSILQWKEALKSLSAKNLKNSAIYNQLEGLSAEALLFFYCMTSSRRCQRAIKHFQEELVAIHLEINGDDIKRLGVEEGKEIKMILNEVLDHKINGLLVGRQEEIKLAQSLITKNKNEKKGVLL